VHLQSCVQRRQGLLLPLQTLDDVGDHLIIQVLVSRHMNRLVGHLHFFFNFLFNQIIQLMRLIPIYVTRRDLAPRFLFSFLTEEARVTISSRLIHTSRILFVLALINLRDQCCQLFNRKYFEDTKKITRDSKMRPNPTTNQTELIPRANFLAFLFLSAMTMTAMLFMVEGKKCSRNGLENGTVINASPTH
jgi:hypothetical protein